MSKKKEPMGSQLPPGVLMVDPTGHTTLVRAVLSEKAMAKRLAAGWSLPKKAEPVKVEPKKADKV
jgi:hypothetical protein